MKHHYNKMKNIKNIYSGINEIISQIETCVTVKVTATTTTTETNKNETYHKSQFYINHELDLAQ